jgi:hypothetical protein
MGRPSRTRERGLPEACRDEGGSRSGLDRPPRRALTHDWLGGEVERRANAPQERALAVFDTLDEWFQGSDFVGSPYINALLEIDEGDGDGERPQPDVLQPKLGSGAVRQILETYARQAGAGDPVEAGHQLYILMTGAIVSACRGDCQAARRARSLAELLLEAPQSPR